MDGQYPGSMNYRCRTVTICTSSRSHVSYAIFITLYVHDIMLLCGGRDLGISVSVSVASMASWWSVMILACWFSAWVLRLSLCASRDFEISVVYVSCAYAIRMLILCVTSVFVIFLDSVFVIWLCVQVSTLAFCECLYQSIWDQVEFDVYPPGDIMSEASPFPLLYLQI